MNSRWKEDSIAAATFSALTAIIIATTSPAAEQIDQETGLVIAKGYETVKMNCTVCHSARIITQNRMDREGWRDTIRWMQKTQGLSELAPEVEDEILSYLSSNYSPAQVYRRPPLKVEWE
jgi:cytochrome c5